MADSVDKIFFEDLAGEDPDDVCRRALCRYDAEGKRYILEAWGDEYVIDPHQSRIDRLSEGCRRPHDYVHLFIVHYLLTSKEIDIRGDWISEKDIPGGVGFFRGPHEIPTHLITARYGENPEEFKTCCERLGGAPLEMADAAYAFQIAPRIPVAVLFWEGDDEFPAESKLLFDKSIADHLALDIIYALAVDVCTRIAANTNGQPRGLDSE